MLKRTILLSSLLSFAFIYQDVLAQSDTKIVIETEPREEITDKSLITSAEDKNAPYTEATFIQQAQKILAPIKKGFMGELEYGLKQGPQNALELCHLKAPHLLEGKDSKKFKIGRTTLRPRNPANAAPSWAVPLLEEYQKSTASGPMPAKAFQHQGKWTYTEPIYIQAICLNCHGEVHGSLKGTIQQKYPRDQALGYKLGEFRGIFWAMQR